MPDYAFRCEKCPRTFKLEEFYSKHKKVHELKKQHKCEVCGFVYGAAKGLEGHMKTHTDTELAVRAAAATMASGFGYQLSRQGVLASAPKVEMSEPIEEKPAPAAVPATLPLPPVNNVGGSGDYKVFDVLPEVTESNCTSAGLYSCAICLRDFSGINSLRKHMPLHSRKVQHSCGSCGYVFGKRDYLHDHMRAKHEKKSEVKLGGGNTVCDVCAVGFSSAEKLAEHHRQHINWKQDGAPHMVMPYRCHICKEIFQLTGVLSAHLRSAHPAHNSASAIKCEQCPLSFGDVQALSRHLVSDHTPNTIASGSSNGSSKKTVFCPSCNQGFTRIYNLKTHLTKMHPNFMHNNLTADEYVAMAKAAAASPPPTLINGVMPSALPTEPAQLPPNFGHYFDVAKGTQMLACPAAPQCPQRFLRKTDLLIHLENEHGQKAHACSLCGEKFLHISELREHITDAHANDAGEPPAVTIRPVSKPGPASAKRAAAAKKRRPGPASRTNAPAENRVSPSMSPHSALIFGNNLPEHLEHALFDPSSQGFTCPDCGKTLQHKQSLVTHMRLMHSSFYGGNKWKGSQVVDMILEESSKLSPKKGKSGPEANAQLCSVCEQVFPNPSSLRNHVVNVHIQGQNWTCDLCGKAFLSQFNLDTHIKEKHPNLNKRLQSLRDALGLTRNLDSNAEPDAKRARLDLLSSFSSSSSSNISTGSISLLQSPDSKANVLPSDSVILSTLSSPHPLDLSINKKGKDAIEPKEEEVDDVEEEEEIDDSDEAPPFSFPYSKPGPLSSKLGKIKSIPLSIISSSSTAVSKIISSSRPLSPNNNKRTFPNLLSFTNTSLVNNNNVSDSNNNNNADNNNNGEAMNNNNNNNESSVDLNTHLVSPLSSSTTVITAAALPPLPLPSSFLPSSPVEVAKVVDASSLVPSGGRKKNSICKICGVVLSPKTNVNVHMRTHSGARPYQCVLCLNRFRQKAHLMKHFRCSHNQKRPPFICLFCPRELGGSNDLYRHITDAHKTETDEYVRVNGIQPPPEEPETAMDISQQEESNSMIALPQHPEPQTSLSLMAPEEESSSSPVASPSSEDDDVRYEAITEAFLFENQIIYPCYVILPFVNDGDVEQMTARSMKEYYDFVGDNSSSVENGNSNAASEEEEEDDGGQLTIDETQQGSPEGSEGPNADSSDKDEQSLHHSNLGAMLNKPIDPEILRIHNLSSNKLNGNAFVPFFPLPAAMSAADPHSAASAVPLPSFLPATGLSKLETLTKVAASALSPLLPRSLSLNSDGDDGSSTPKENVGPYNAEDIKIDESGAAGFYPNLGDYSLPFSLSSLWKKKADVLPPETLHQLEMIQKMNEIKELNAQVSEKVKSTPKPKSKQSSSSANTTPKSVHYPTNSGNRKQVENASPGQSTIVTEYENQMQNNHWPVDCIKCNATQDTLENFNIHMNEHWSDDKCCPVCGLLINSKRFNFKQHLKIHTGEKPFVCKICSRSFRQKAHMVKHITTHREGGSGQVAMSV